MAAVVHRIQKRRQSLSGGASVIGFGFEAEADGTGASPTSDRSGVVGIDDQTSTLRQQLKSRRLSKRLLFPSNTPRKGERSSAEARAAFGYASAGGTNEPEQKETPAPASEQPTKEASGSSLDPAADKLKSRRSSIGLSLTADDCETLRAPSTPLRTAPLLRLT